MLPPPDNLAKVVRWICLVMLQRFLSITKWSKFAVKVLFVTTALYLRALMKKWASVSHTTGDSPELHLQVRTFELIKLRKSITSKSVSNFLLN